MSYASVAALCLYDAGALDGLMASARHDALTGCLNYAAIRSELEREVGRSARHRRPMSFCFVDLDRFKSVNEQSGHQHGNRVLGEVGTVLRGGIRIEDSVGRYGGDEFIVVLPDSGHDAAHALAERLPERICTATTERGHERLDASIGVAQWQAGTTADELLAAADDALRVPKRLGGGTVAGAGDVAAGASRGVAGGSDRIVPARRGLTSVGDSQLGM